MLKRTIVITSASKLSVKNGQLVCTNIDNQSDVKTAPVEDLGVVLVENQRASLSVPLINALSDNNVSIVYCDAHGMPTSMVVSLSANTTQSEMQRAQISASASLNKRIWKQIVEAKIKNQIRLLDKLGKDGGKLKPLAANVKSGDSDNREGIAARLYWTELFSRDFVRDREGAAPNNLLNYGYAILRSATARALLGSGLNPAFGIFHRNKYNSMPLVDDVMEPFRPFVDDVVYGLHSNGETQLTTDVKCYLADVLSCDTIFDGCRRPLLIGLSMMTASLGRCYLDNVMDLSFPKLE